VCATLCAPGQLQCASHALATHVFCPQVDAKGEVYRSEKRRIGRYLAQTAIAQQLLRQVGGCPETVCWV
jgi:hypothetical protein